MSVSSACAAGLTPSLHGSPTTAHTAARAEQCFTMWLLEWLALAQTHGLKGKAAASIEKHKRHIQRSHH